MKLKFYMSTVVNTQVNIVINSSSGEFSAMNRTKTLYSIDRNADRQCALL